MSWFETSNWQSSIGSLAKTAKTALKHAQKNIDKVLDIPEVHVEASQEEAAAASNGEKHDHVLSIPSPSSRSASPDVKQETDGFFSMFGLGSAPSTKPPSKSPSTASLSDSSKPPDSLQEPLALSGKSSTTSLNSRHSQPWSSSQLHAVSSQISDADGMIEINLLEESPSDAGILSEGNQSVVDLNGRSENSLESDLANVEEVPSPYASQGRLEILFHDEEDIPAAAVENASAVNLLLDDVLAAQVEDTDSAALSLEEAPTAQVEEIHSADLLVDVSLENASAEIIVEDAPVEQSRDVVEEDSLEEFVEHQNTSVSDVMVLEEELVIGGLLIEQIAEPPIVSDAQVEKVIEEETLGIDVEEVVKEVDTDAEASTSLLELVSSLASTAEPESAGRVDDDVFRAEEEDRNAGSGFREESVFVGVPSVEDIRALVVSKEADEVQVASESIAEKATSQFDFHSMQKEMDEMKLILNSRETKLVEMKQENARLKEEKDNLSSHVAELTSSEEEKKTMIEEYVERISQLERKLQKSEEDKKSLTNQLHLTKTELANSSRNRGDTTATQLKDALRAVEEKDMQIKELLEEGEKLSKQQFQSTTHIKKIRAQQTQLETDNTKLKSEVEERAKEVTALKTTVAAAEELEEKNQNLIRHLNTSVDRLEKEVLTARSQQEESKAKMSLTQTALDTAYRELADLHRQRATQDGQVHETLLSAEIESKEKMREALEKQREQLVQDQEELVQRVQTLQSNVTRMEGVLKRKEESFRQEIADYQQRLQEATSRNEELSENLTHATRPLLRQNAALQRQLAQQASTFDQLQMDLNKRLQEAISQSFVAQEKERANSERLATWNGKTQALEAQIAVIREERDSFSREVDREHDKLRQVEEQLRTVQQERATIESEAAAVKREKSGLEHQTALLREQLDMERRKAERLTQQLNDRQRQMQLQETSSVFASASETGMSGKSFKRSESVSSTGTMEGRWSPSASSQLDAASTGNSLYDVLRSGGVGGNTPFLDSVQAQLKLRDGQVQHLRNELRQLETERQNLVDQLSRTGETDQQVEQLKGQIETLKQANQDILKRHNAMLQMYGEKTEELQELKLDYEDMKTLYKSQIDALTRVQAHPSPQAP